MLIDAEHIHPGQADRDAEASGGLPDGVKNGVPGDAELMSQG